MSEVALDLESEIEVLNKTVVSIYELTKRSNSSLIRKGTAGKPNERRINSSRECYLPMTSRKWNEKTKSMLKTQYVMGANTTFTDHDSVDADGKIIPSLKKQGYDLKDELRRSVSLAIKFKYGQLNLKEYTSDAALYDFVVNHEDNEDAPHPKGGRDINKLPQFTFKALRPEIKAKKIVDQFDETMEALRFVDKLRSKKLDGTFAYNRELINVSCAIFEVGQGLTDEDDNQKMQVIIQLATKSGPTFLKEIESTFNEYRLGIANAEKFEILVRSSKEAKLKIGEDTIAVKTFTKTEDKDKIDELMYLFISDPKGQENYRQMTAETELKQSQMISKGAKNKK